MQCCYTVKAPQNTRFSVTFSLQQLQSTILIVLFLRFDLCRVFSHYKNKNGIIQCQKFWKIKGKKFMVLIRAYKGLSGLRIVIKMKPFCAALSVCAQCPSEASSNIVTVHCTTQASNNQSKLSTGMSSSLSQSINPTITQQDNFKTKQIQAWAVLSSVKLVGLLSDTAGWWLCSSNTLILMSLVVGWGGGVGEVGSRGRSSRSHFLVTTNTAEGTKPAKVWTRRSAEVSHKVILTLCSQSSTHPALLEASPCPVQCKRDVGKAIAAWSPGPQACSSARRPAQRPVAPRP